VQIQELVDQYQKKTDEELLRLARDREQLTPEASSALTDELARRKIAAGRLKAFSKEEERQERKDAFRSKRLDCSSTTSFHSKYQQSGKTLRW